MYDLVDRPVADLEGFERRILGAMRQWVQALGALGPGRVYRGDAFSQAMRALNDGSTAELVLERPCHAQVGETEAVLLGLWRLVRDGRDAAAKAAAALIVDGPRADMLVGAMRTLVHA